MILHAPLCQKNRRHIFFLIGEKPRQLLKLGPECATPYFWFRVCRQYFLSIECVVDLEEFSWGDAIAPYHSQRKATIREAIAQRLRKVCSDLPETEFQELVEQMADKQLRGERRLSDL